MLVMKPKVILRDLWVLSGLQCSFVGSVGTHYENTSIQMYWNFYHQKMKIFRKKNLIYFHISARNRDCGYSLEPPPPKFSYCRLLFSQTCILHFPNILTAVCIFSFFQIFLLQFDFLSNNKAMLPHLPQTHLLQFAFSQTYQLCFFSQILSLQFAFSQAQNSCFFP